jgi:TatD DNase family protein
MLVDSHCHLNYKGLVEQQAAVLDRARRRGVTAMLNIATRESEWDDVLAAAEAHDDVWASVGIHPHDADHHPDVDTEKLVMRAAHPRVIGIGETGLDYFYDKSDRARQQASFQTHLAAAQEAGLPVIVHTRDAEADTLALLAEAKQDKDYCGVIHCFTASAEFARAALDLGLYISLSGIVTFKNASVLQDTARWLPADRLLVETDAPFLAPVPLLPTRWHLWRTCAGRMLSLLLRRRARISIACLRRRSHDQGPHPRVRDIVGRSADRQ